MARLLTRAGADPNLATADGTTALKLATEAKNQKLVELLQAAGATR